MSASEKADAISYIGNDYMSGEISYTRALHLLQTEPVNMAYATAKDYLTALTEAE